MNAGGTKALFSTSEAERCCHLVKMQHDHYFFTVFVRSAIQQKRLKEILLRAHP